MNKAIEGVVAVAMSAGGLYLIGVHTTTLVSVGVLLAVVGGAIAINLLYKK